MQSKKIQISSSRTGENTELKVILNFSPTTKFMCKFLPNNPNYKTWKSTRIWPKVYSKFSFDPQSTKESEITPHLIEVIISEKVRNTEMQDILKLKKMMGLFLWQNERSELQIIGLGDSDELSTGKQTFRDQSGMQPFDWTECYGCFKKGNGRSKVHTFWNELNRNCIKNLHLLRNKLSYK